MDPISNYDTGTAARIEPREFDANTVASFSEKVKPDFEGIDFLYFYSPEMIDDFTQSMEELFFDLSTRWKQETKAYSSIGRKKNHTDYQTIISLGRAMLPYILQDLERDVHHWFPALKAISGVDPVPAERRGNVATMREAWLAWGRAEKIIR